MIWQGKMQPGMVWPFFTRELIEVKKPNRTLRERWELWTGQPGCSCLEYKWCNERERDNYWSHLAHQSDMIASQPHQSLGLADKLERVTARSSLPARVAVADVEAEPDWPGETIVLQWVVELQWGRLAALRPPELRNSLSLRPLPDPGALSLDVVPCSPVLASPPPGHPADELHEPLVLGGVLQPQ